MEAAAWVGWSYSEGGGPARPIADVDEFLRATQLHQYAEAFMAAGAEVSGPPASCARSTFGRAPPVSRLWWSRK
jgi:hypothetical protein